MNSKKTLAASAAAAALLASAACGSSSTSTGSGSGSNSGSGSSSSSSGSSSSSDSAMANLVGPGCAAYAKAVPSGSGSVDGMAKAKVASAAGSNPLLKTLTAAVSGKLNKKVNLVDALNGGQYTVFAPVDSAFAKLPKSTVKTLETAKGAKTLEQILTYHVIKGQIAPDAIDGKHTTLEGGKVSVKGSGNNITVDGNAHVICGGVKTANATVYLIDSVLSPKM